MDIGQYLISKSFNRLCYALEISQENIKENNINVEDDLYLIIYNEIMENKEIPKNYPMDSDEIFKVLRDYKYYFQIFNQYYDEFFDITFTAVYSGKINSLYLLDKYMKNLLLNYCQDDIELAKTTILLCLTKFLIDKKRPISYEFLMNNPSNNKIILTNTSKQFLIKDLLSKFKNNPLDYEEILKHYYNQIETILSTPSIKVKDFILRDLLDVFLIIEDNFLANFIDELIAQNSDEYNLCNCNYLVADETFLNHERVFQIFACGLKDNDKIVFKARFDDVKFYINANLVYDLPAIEVSEKSRYDYLLKSFKKHSRCYSFSDETVETYDNFKLKTFFCSKDNKKSYYIDVLDKKEYPKVKLDKNNLVDQISRKKITPVFHELIDLLNLDIDFAYNLQNQVISKNLTQNQIIDILNKKLGFKDFDKSNIINAQIENLIEFREITDEKYIQKLSEYMYDKEIINNHISQYLNQIIGDDLRREGDRKYYLDVGKYAAPRWLMYPELARGTMGWRMGYGQSYWLNLPYETEEFKELFPQPQNWLAFDDKEYNGAKNLKEYTALAMFWRKDGIPKYSTINEDDYIVVNDFITLTQVDKEFRMNALRFSNIKSYILCVKGNLLGRCGVRFDFTNLNEDFEISCDELELWNHFKYSACLNGAYYKIMNDDNLKQVLLSTADKSLVYISDDEWGGDENLFGFALMELRDEIRRLYKNNDKIDWEYSEYLAHKPFPYF